ncbi:MAG: choice-of-anchor D domain-containing protein [Myxococcaceae bacterium]
MKTRLLALAVVALFGCTTNMPQNPMTNGVPAFRGLVSTPPQLAYTCVVPGCDTTLTVKVQSNVNRRIAIKRIVLSSMTEDEYTITTDQPAPFILGAASDFAIDVRFAPRRAPTDGALNLLVTYTDASAEMSADRIEAGELKIPLVKRLVGEPQLAVKPGSISFGVVAPMARKELPVTVSNAGFGNIALEVDRADSGVAVVTVALPQSSALIPDASVPVPFVFAPMTEQYLKGEVEIGSSTPGVDSVFVGVEGTSYTTPRVALEPEEAAIDFGEIPKGMRQMVTVKVANVGGLPLQISSLSATDPSNRVTVTFQGGMTMATLMPLQRLSIDVAINGSMPGVIDVPLHIVSNDPVRAMLDIPIRATITEPKIETTPTALDFGTVPMGWVVSKSIELKNVGYGALTIKRITFVGGTSNLYAFKNLPSLPAKLDRNSRAAFDVEFRAQATANFQGSVSIETDDPLNPFAEVTLNATGGSCATACPIAHGTPSCNNGSCTIGMCNATYFDTNGDPADGCECHETGSDPGGFCAMGLNKGTLSDNGSNANYTGMITSATDEDYIIFFGEDQSQVFSDPYDVRINLQSSDPNIKMCVSRFDTSVTVNECYPDSNKSCGILSYRHDGSYGREDGAMYYIKVYRDPVGVPACVTYTVYMSNG